MTRITPDLLNDTYHLIQLARETARLQGNQAQAERLAPVADNLRTLVGEAREPKASVAGAGVMGQDDFQALLAAVKEPLQKASPSPAAPTTHADRSRVILAMAGGGMTDLDIARQLGMTRDEVKLILSVSR
jgi:hypothetical protein